MVFAFYILAVLLVYFSYRSFRGGLDYLNYFKGELAKPSSDREPFATVIAPCKGVDQGMLENFDALLRQDYPDYEVIFVIDDPDDDAARIVESAWREAERQVKLVVAPIAVGSSQKVENLREGVLHASDASEIFVFADSDARPSPGWLRSLVSALAESGIGAATGYRWFISDRRSLAGELRSVWNASIASALGPDTKSNFCWGGSTAIRRRTFEELNIRERWKGTVSDDFTLTRAVREAGLDIKFVPEAMAVSVGDCSLRELFEFTTRQIKITRVYMPRLWVVTFVGAALYCLVIIWAFATIFLSPANSLEVWAAIGTLAAVAVLSAAKSIIRLNAVARVFPQFAHQIRGQYLAHGTLWAITPFIYLYNSVAALFSRSIRWRGRRYQMLSATRTVAERTE